MRAERINTTTQHIDDRAEMINTTTQHIDDQNLAALPTIHDIPGPVVEDREAYQTGNHHYLTQLHETYGDMFALPQQGKRDVFVRCPDLARQVLGSVHDFGKTWDSAEASSNSVDYVMNLIQPLMRNTIFNFQGEANASRRATFQPTFHAVGTFVKHIDGVFDEELESWDEGSVDIQTLSHNLIKKGVLTLLCGEFAAQAYGCLPVFDKVMDYFVERYALPDHDQRVTAEDDVMMKRLAQASAEVVQNFKTWSKTCATPKEVTNCALFHVMLKNGFSDEEMAATMVNIIIAAGEAPASALAQTLEELAMHGDTQAKVRAEYGRVGRGENIASHLQKMPYSLRCMVEGFRVFAPATLVQRQAMRDCSLNGYSIPKGTVIGVCVQSVHMNSKVWKKPESFKPSRKHLHYGTSKGFTTFSHGPRQCPGRHIAVAICQLALVKVVSNFRLSMDPAQTPSRFTAKVPKMVAWSVHGIPVVVERIPRNRSRM
jgi:cytochrome P450